MMNDQTEDLPIEPAPEAAAESAPVVPTPQFNDSKRRLRELLSVPERDRTDEQWDEIIELEIQLAPGNRIAPNERQGGGIPGGGHAGHHGKPGGGGVKKHRPRTGNNRRPRGNKPQGGGQPA